VVIAAALLYGWGTSNLAALSGGDLMGVRMPSAVKMRLHWVGIESAAVTVFVTSIVGGLWPAARAARLKPVEAVRHV
jgi:ABC-type antimicrobial peptide transport system permease subunit